jgi:hypothetical protein
VKFRLLAFQDSCTGFFYLLSGLRVLQTFRCPLSMMESLLYVVQLADVKILGSICNTIITYLNHISGGELKIMTYLNIWRALSKTPYLAVFASNLVHDSSFLINIPLVFLSPFSLESIYLIFHRRKLILAEIFPSVQKHDIFLVLIPSP